MRVFSRATRVAFAVASTAMITALPAPAAAALLLGNTVQISYEFPAKGSVAEGPFDNLVGTTGDTVFSGGRIIASPNDTQLRIHSDCMSNLGCIFVPFSFNGIHLRDALGTITAFASVTVNGLTTLPGFDNSHISFDADNIFLDFGGLSGDPYDVVVDIRTAGGVPEPANWALMIAGFGLTGAAIRRRRGKVRTEGGLTA